MRKISKISLVAAVAVAGFSTANAQPLEEAIKNVEIKVNLKEIIDVLVNLGVHFIWVKIKLFLKSLIFC